MCGILGVFRTSGLTVDDRWLVRRMADAIRHRGPDGEGFVVQDRIAIGMRRLSIIDTEGGWQPIWNEDRTVAVVANGEIYNFVELRRSLESRGHRFSTSSDCETIVHLYEELGDGCVAQLRGMFAFAILDLRSHTLTLCRDRMGEKPLMLVERGDFLAFCSELAGLVGSGAVPFELDAGAVNMYFHWGVVPEAMSAVAGTRKLPAGAILRVDLRTGQRTERIYWSMGDAPAVYGDPVELIREELRTVGTITMRSDVPVGVGLSSGVDSSAIAVMARAHASQPVSAFSVGYEGLTWQDETAQAEQFAEHLGMPFHRVRINVERVVREFPEVCLRRDDPIADIAGSNVYALMRLAREHDVPVLLSGLGGDELFWGYSWFRDSVEATIRKRCLLEGRSGVLDYLQPRMPPMSLAGMANWLQAGGGLLSGLSRWRNDARAPADRLVFWDNQGEYSAVERVAPSLFGDAMHATGMDPASPFTGPAFWSDLPNSMVELLCSTYLRCNGLGQTDRLSMACSVEGRVPFVDYRLAELVVGLRKSGSDRQLGHKAWLKAAFRGLVPESVFERPKRGFSPPWRRWSVALMRAYGPDLEGGELVSSGILCPAAAAWLRSPFDRLGRPRPMAFSSLVLEQWARGMRMLSLASSAGRNGEPDLGGVRRTN